jgi:membrane fusion protein, copper/silver efflux system
MLSAIRAGRLTLFLVFFLGVGLGALLGGLFSGGSGDETPTRDATEGTAQTKATVWTCSMHPQIKLPKPGQCPICFMDIIPLESTDDDADSDPRQLRLTERAAKLARIETNPVERRWVDISVEMVGRVAYDESRVKTIAAWFPGRLERLFVDYTGIRVKRGDHLVQIYSPELHTAEAELLEALRAEKRLSESSAAFVREAARANVEATREKLRLWGLSTAQIKNIETKGVVSDRETIHAPIGGVVIAKNASEGDFVQTGAKIYTIADLERLWLEMEAYESDLEWLRYGQQVEFRVEAFPGETFRARISYIAPFFGGGKRTVTVRANVNNEDGRLKPGMFARATVQAVIGEDNQVVDVGLAGKWISPMHPEIIKDKPGVCDICGMPLVRAEELGFVTTPSADEPPLVIPASAPLLTGRRAVVYVLLPDRDQPTYEGRIVTLGSRAGDWFIVKSGLVEGEQVVTRGNFKIDSALQIQARPSMMSQVATAETDEHLYETETEPTSPALSRLQAPQAFLAQLAPLYDAYFSIQETLAKDDPQSARAGAEKLKKTLDSVEMTLLEGEAHGAWMKQLDMLRKAGSALAKASEIEHARRAFNDLSQAAITVQKLFGHAGTIEHHLIFCPMAFDDKGASWLATSQEVANPYFGARMLRCGVVKESFAPRVEDAPHEEHSQ